MWVGALMLVLALAEGVWLSASRRSPDYDWRATGCSMADFCLRNVVHVFLGLSIATPVLDFAWTHRINTVAEWNWANFIGLMLGVEFLYYVQHWAQHKTRYLWINHAVHHSPQQIYFSTAIRVGVSGKLIGNFLFFAPLLWLGYDLETVTIAISLNFFYQFFIHSEWIPRLPWVEGILNTPSSHRVHHGANLAYLDCNYGGFTVLFDRLFGTYVPENDQVKIRYGLVHPLDTYNPIRLNLHQWILLFRDLRSATSLNETLQLLWRPPGWSIDPKRDESVGAMRARARVTDLGLAQSASGTTS